MPLLSINLENKINGRVNDEVTLTSTGCSDKMMKTNEIYCSYSHSCNDLKIVHRTLAKLQIPRINEEKGSELKSMHQPRNTANGQSSLEYLVPENVVETSSCLLQQVVRMISGEMRRIGSYTQRAMSDMKIMITTSCSKPAHYVLGICPYTQSRVSDI